MTIVMLHQSNSSVMVHSFNLRSRQVLLKLSVCRHNYGLLTHAQGHNRCEWKHKLSSIFKHNLDSTSMRASTSYLQIFPHVYHFSTQLPAEINCWKTLHSEVNYPEGLCAVTHTHMLTQQISLWNNSIAENLFHS